jgi:hypothetical protein
LARTSSLTRDTEDGMTNEQVTFPFDAFKTRMQAESWTTGDDQNKSKSKPTLRQVIRYTIATQGWKACFAGLAPTLIRYVFSLCTRTKLMNRAMPVSPTHL